MALFADTVRPRRAFTMKSIRCLFGVVGFLAVWLVVAAVVGLSISFLFPAAAGHDEGIINGRNLPGSVLGIWLGYQLFRAIVRAPKKTEVR